MLRTLRTLSFIVSILSIVLLGNLLGFNTIPNPVIIIAIFVISLTLGILGTKYNQVKKAD